MTKQDLIDHLTHECGLHRASAIRAVEGVTEAITASLSRGEDVTLRGFATLRVVEKAKKIGRNISAGTPVVIPAHRSVKLIISKELKNRLNYGSK